MSDDGLQFRCRVRIHEDESGSDVYSDSATLTVRESTITSVYNLSDDGDITQYAIMVDDDRGAPTGDLLIEAMMMWDGTEQKSNIIPVLRNGFSDSSFNWRIRLSSSSGNLSFAVDGPAVQLDGGALVPNQWTPVRCGIDRETDTQWIEVGEQRNEISSTSTPAGNWGIYALNTTTDVEGAPGAQGYHVKDIKITEDDGAYLLNFPCNEGSGLVWTEAGGRDGELRTEAIHIEDPLR